MSHKAIGIFDLGSNNDSALNDSASTIAALTVAALNNALKADGTRPPARAPDNPSSTR